LGVPPFSETPIYRSKIGNNVGRFFHWFPVKKKITHVGRHTEARIFVYDTDSDNFLDYEVRFCWVLVVGGWEFCWLVVVVFCLSVSVFFMFFWLFIVVCFVFLLLLGCLYAGCLLSQPAVEICKSSSPKTV